MSKIIIMGPLELLMETLTLIQQLGIMQVDEEFSTGMEEDKPVPVPQLLDKDTVLQHQLYENLIDKIRELQFYLLPPSSQLSEINHPITIESLVTILPLHLAENQKRTEAMENLGKEVDECEAYKVFVNALSGLVDDEVHHETEYIGVQIEKQEDVPGIQEFLEREYQRKVAFEVVSGKEDKPLISVIIVETEEADKVRQALEERRIKIFKPPDGMEGLGFSEQLERVAGRIREKKESLKLLKEQHEIFANQWYWRYMQTCGWIESRLSLINITAAVVKTRMCFFIHGWLPVADFHELDEKLQEKFQGLVVVEEDELVEQDFSRIPTALHNPAYFEPFELFTRLLPMPPYASFDLTPFIGIFFPVFFGMMLGDIGYGLILLGVSVYLVHRFEKKKNLRDAGKILFISSLYTIVFGLLYGELLGTVGHKYLGLKPIFFDRQASIVPMLCFAVAAGVVHVIIGLVLGIIVSLRRKMKKEAVFKLVNIIVILCICVLVVSYFTRSMAQVQKPLLLTIAVVVPTLILFGGLMAPLELLKHIGNIVSYARIMAVGLTSVLLAFVANYMAGRMGSVWAGIIVAVLLHVFNLMLGVFAPTIHSLRLHYVEFLSKFMESGGKEFKPLGRKQ